MSFTILPAFRLIAVLLALVAATVFAERGWSLPPPGTCFAVTPLGRNDVPPATARCSGAPERYRDAVLWLRLPSPAGGRTAVLVHSTRFDSMAAIFVRPDGTREVDAVRRGAFGHHWHIGGQIAFRPKGGPVEATWLRIERLQSYGLLRIRLVPDEATGRQSEIAAALIGAALSLLLLASVYNFGLAIVMRGRLFVWQGLWAASVVSWGLVWSQGALLIAPGIAGPTASRLSTVLSCLAILFATLAALSALIGVLSRRVRRVILGGAISVVALGVLSIFPDADLGIIGAGLSILVLAVLGGIGWALTLGWRRGNRQARDLLIAWTGPMLVLGATQLFDFSTTLFGGGAQIAVLFASAFQTLCFASLATYRLGGLRIERDAAIASEALLVEMAERDVLTGLLNRRGFVRRCEEAFGTRTEVPFALLIIDVDRFKSINDRFGHEVGDAVLVGLGAKLGGCDRRHPCLIGRLGGEEFVIGVSGLSGPPLAAFAEEVRAMLSAAPVVTAIGEAAITVSIGVAEGHGSGPFHLLYGAADRALYRAKAAGRDRVVLCPPAPPGVLEAACVPG